MTMRLEKVLGFRQTRGSDEKMSFESEAAGNREDLSQI